MVFTYLSILAQAAAILFLPGAVAAAAAGKKAGFRDPVEFVFFSGILSFAFASVAGLALAYLGWFSVSRLAGLALICSIGIFLVLPPRSKRPVFGKFRGTEPVLLLAVLLGGAALFFRPVPYVFGGWDPGVYANTAVHLAREGTLFPTDGLAGRLPAEEIGRLAWRHSSGYPEKYPGFRYHSLETGRLIPEFYHLFPLWLAVFYSRLGLPAMFCLTPLLGLAALAAVFLAVRELWGGKTALAAAGILVFNVVQIWQARFPTAEMLSQLLLFGGAAAVFKYLKRESAFWAFAGAAAWGLFIMARVSSLLLWLPVAVFFYCRWWKNFKKNDLVFLIPLAGFTVLSFLPQVLGDWRYFANSVANLRLEGLSWKAGLAAAGAAVGTAAGLRLLPSRPRAAIARAAVRPSARWLLLAIVALAGWYAYFLRPFIGPPSADRTNLVEIGWLLGPAVLAFAFLGVLLFVIEERSPAAWLFFLVIAAPAAVFTWRQMIHYHYLWAARRFADAVIPGFIVFAAYALRRTARAGVGGKLFSLAALPLLLAASIYNSAPLFFHREYRGAVEFMEGLAGKVDQAGIVFVKGGIVDKIPAPLDFVYGLRVLPVYRERDVREEVFDRLADRAARAGEKIFWIGDASSPPPDGGGWRLMDRMVFHSPLWERRYDRLPRKVDPAAADGNFTVYIYRKDAVPDPEGR